MMGRFSNLEFEGNEPLREQAGEEPRDERYYLRLAEEDYRTARFERALRYYSRSLEFNPNLVAAWVGQVQMLIELGELKEGRLWADKALEIHRDQSELLSAKAVAVARLGEVRKAVEFSDAAMAQKGTTPLVWLARGETLLASRGGNSETCFEKAASESRHDWFIHLRIGRVCLYWNAFARGLAWAQKCVQSEAGQPFAWHVLGDCQWALGFAGEAERAYEQALSIDRGFSISRSALGRVRRRGPVGRAWDRARSWLRGGKR